MSRMPEVVPEQTKVVLHTRGKESWKIANFLTGFRDVFKELSDAYHVSGDIYTQTSAMHRLETGASINEIKEFLRHVDYRPNQAEDIIKHAAVDHSPTRVYLGHDTPVDIGITISSDKILRLGPDDAASGRSDTVAALIQRAARLEALLSSDGIPDAYATAQGQAGRALKLVEKAAQLAYDWNPDWGRVTVDEALRRAAGVLTRQRVVRAATITALALAGCNGITPTSVISPDITPPVITQIVESTVTPAPYTTEAAPGVQYGPPSLSEATFLEGAGGSARDVVLEKTGMADIELAAYENAAYAGAEKSGFAHSQVEFIYLYDQVHKGWNMVLKLSDGGYLWSQKISDGTYSTFPLQIKIVPGGGTAWNADYALVPVPDSADAEAFYTAGGFVELKGGSHVSVGADTYYSQWFNTLTGQWEAIADVQAALRASLPDFYQGLAPTLEQFPVVEKSDIPAIIAYLRSQPSLLTPDSPAPRVGPTIVSSPLGEAHMGFMCNLDGIINCAPAATFQFNEQIGEQTIDAHVILWEIRNSDGSRGYLTVYTYDSVQMNGGRHYPRIVANPTGSKDLILYFGVDRRAEVDYSYMMYLFTQPGLMEYVQQWMDTGIIPPELEVMIVPGT